MTPALDAFSVVKKKNTHHVVLQFWDINLQKHICEALQVVSSETKLVEYPDQDSNSLEGSLPTRLGVELSLEQLLQGYLPVDDDTTWIPHQSTPARGEAKLPLNDDFVRIYLLFNFLVVNLLYEDTFASYGCGPLCDKDLISKEQLRDMQKYRTEPNVAVLERWEDRGNENKSQNSLDLLFLFSMQISTVTFGAFATRLV
ncbi:hypothetical protein F5Y05DRAFT_424114 [Hypoxylon sp. FL0543]|nr:hypothetical protein F5Y05DRAFT_424114 [Hypoxylon sp. FL0543]